MRHVTKMLVIGAGSALLAVPALAQGRPLPPQPPPTRAQQAEAGHATPPAPAPSATVTPRYGYDPYYDYGQPVLYTDVPVTVASDGLVYANFGFGFQLVPNQCAAQRYTRAPRVVQPAPPVQPQVTQPVPVPAAPPQPVNVATGATAPSAAGACWTRTRDGRVVIAH